MKQPQLFYDEYHKKNKKFNKIISKNNFTYFPILNFFYKEIYPRLMTGKESFEQVTLLDVGCGVGTLALYFGSIGAEVLGIDISERAIEIATTAKDSLNLMNVTFKNELLKKGDKNKDLVVISEVIEHIEDDDAFLRDIFSHLKEDGLLFLTTPSKENVLYRLGFYKKFDKKVGHLRRYTVNSLQRILRANGFEVLALKKSEGPMRNLLYTTPLGFLIRYIRGPLVPLYHFFDTLSLTLFGESNILLVARKK